MKTNLSTRPGSHGLHLDEQPLPPSIHVVLLFDFPRDGSGSKQGEEAQRKGDEEVRKIHPVVLREGDADHDRRPEVVNVNTERRVAGEVAKLVLVRRKVGFKLPLGRVRAGNVLFYDNFCVRCTSCWHKMQEVGFNSSISWSNRPKELPSSSDFCRKVIFIVAFSLQEIKNSVSTSCWGGVFMKLIWVRFRSSNLLRLKVNW